MDDLLKPSIRGGGKGIELTAGQNSGDTAEVFSSLVFPWARAINITITAPLPYGFYKKEEPCTA